MKIIFNKSSGKSAQGDAKQFYNFLRSLLLSIIALHILVGCATTAPRTPEYFANEYGLASPKMHKIGVIASLAVPEIGEVDLGMSKGEAAARGSLGGAMEGMGAVLSDVSSCSGSFCGAASVLVLSIAAVVGTITGAIVGSGHGTSADLLAQAEANARQMLASSNLQTQLVQRAEEYGRHNLDLEFVRIDKTAVQMVDGKPSYKSLPDKSIDAVLELDLQRFTIQYALEIDARARLVSTKTGEVLNDSQYRFLSERRMPVEWINNGTTTLIATINAGLQDLAEDIIDEDFLLYYPKEPAKQPVPDKADTDKNDKIESKKSPVPHYVLAPLYPQLKTCFICKHGRSLGNLDFVEVNSLTPTFRWEKFPRQYDSVDNDGNLHQITEVHYDLRIYDIGMAFLTAPFFGKMPMPAPGALIQYVRGIPAAYYKISDSLNECTNYYWTVRARFKLDGNARVTEWAGAFDVGGWSSRPWNLRRGVAEYKMGSVPDRPEMFYYPFRTPCASK